MCRSDGKQLIKNWRPSRIQQASTDTCSSDALLQHLHLFSCETSTPPAPSPTQSQRGRSEWRVGGVKTGTRCEQPAVATARSESGRAVRDVRTATGGINWTMRGHDSCKCPSNKVNIWLAVFFFSLHKPGTFEASQNNAQELYRWRMWAVNGTRTHHRVTHLL